MRHGTSILGGTGRWQGWSQVPLSKGGSREVVRLRESGRLPEARAIHASSLLRCSQTAELLFPGADIALDDRLRTRRLGCWRAHRSEEIVADGGAWFHPFATDAPPGGESLAQVELRLRGYLSGVEDDEHRVVVTHGAVIGILMSWVGRRPFVIPPCEFVTAEVLQGRLHKIDVSAPEVPPV